jgi:hypothetical protein
MTIGYKVTRVEGTLVGRPGRPCTAEQVLWELELTLWNEWTKTYYTARPYARFRTKKSAIVAGERDSANEKTRASAKGWAP